MNVVTMIQIYKIECYNRKKLKDNLLSMKKLKTYLEFSDFTLLKYFIQDIIKLQNDL